MKKYDSTNSFEDKTTMKRGFCDWGTNSFKPVREQEAKRAWKEEHYYENATYAKTGNEIRGSQKQDVANQDQDHVKNDGNSHNNYAVNPMRKQ